MKSTTRFAKNLIVGLAFGAVSFGAQADVYDDGLMAYAVGNYAKAGELFMGAAETGNAGAEHMLMRMFSEGVIFAPNMKKETMKWTQKAAERGFMQAQYAMAEMLRADKNMAEALSWYRKAADQGHPDAYYQLGEMLEDASGTESHHMYQIAASEYDVFAQKGDAQYQYMLGGMYQQAKGVGKDMKLALKWLEKSALQGHAMAQLSLGRLYATGDDVKRDAQQAAYWLNLAAAQGVTEAEHLLAQIKDDGEVKIALAM